MATTDEVETITYQFTVPKDTWDEFKATVQNDTTVQSEVVGLIDWRADNNDPDHLREAILPLIESDVWRDFIETVPQSRSVRSELVSVLEQRAYGDVPEQLTDEGLSIVESETWEQWRDTVPRSTPLGLRIKAMLEEDMKATHAGGYDDMEERTARLLASRIERRSHTARQAIERNDIDAVDDHLEKIGEIAATFSE